MKRAANILLLLLVAAGAGCQPAYVTTHPAAALPPGKTDVTVPLAVGGHALLVRARANGRDAGYFLLDTGAPVNAIDGGLADRLWLLRYRKERLSDIGGGHTCWARTLSSLALGELTLSRHAAVAPDLGLFGRALGADVTGILGSPLFSAVPLTIDYRDATITFHERAGFRPPAPTYVGALPMQVRDRKPYVQATINGTHEGWFLLDTGTTAALTINQAFAKAKGMALESRCDHKIAGPVGMLLCGSALVGSLEVLGQKFSDILCTTAPGGEGEPAVAGLIGAGILRHFRLTFDYAQGRLYAQYRPPPSVEQLARQPGGVDARDFLGYTPLALAAQQNEAGRARELIVRGADLNARTKGRRLTPLIIAAFHAALEAAHVLIEGGADVNAAMRDGSTALMIAAHGGNEQLVQALLARGANVNAATDSGFTPLMGAVEGRRAGLVKLLIRHGADVQARDKLGRTALQHAQDQGDPDVIGALRQAGARR